MRKYVVLIVWGGRMLVEVAEIVCKARRAINDSLGGDGGWRRPPWFGGGSGGGWQQRGW